MRSFLWPHAMMTRRDAYVAALHPDDEIAGEAFEKWTNGLDPEDIDFPQHKLINLAYPRFKQRLAGETLDGFFQNVQRLRRLKFQSNLFQLKTILRHEACAKIDFVALGETNEWLLAGGNAEMGVPGVELAVPRADLNDACQALGLTGLAQKRLRRPSLRAGGQFVVFRGPMNFTLRLVGLNTWPSDVSPCDQFENLCGLTARGYWDIMCTRSASLNAHRDQLLFDWALLGAKGQLPSKAPKRLGISRYIDEVFGRSGPQKGA